MKISFRLGHKDYPTFSGFRQSYLAHDSVGWHLGRTQLGRLPFAPQHTGRSSAFSKSSLYIWKFSVHILLKSSLKDFGQYLASTWNEHNCTAASTCCSTGKPGVAESPTGLSDCTPPLLAECTLPLRLVGPLAQDWLGVMATGLAVGWDCSPSTSLSFQPLQVASSGFLTRGLGSKIEKEDATKAFEALALKPPSIKPLAF